MAEIALAGGLVVDVATRDDLDHHHERLRALVPKVPKGRYYEISAAGTLLAAFSGSGPIAIAFNPMSPPAGRLWFLQWVSIWSAGTAAAPVQPASGAIANLFASVMKGRAPLGPGGQAFAFAGPVNWSDVIIPGQAVPSPINVPDKTVCKSQVELYVVLAGSALAASTTYMANAGVIDVPDDDEVYFW